MALQLLEKMIDNFTAGIKLIRRILLYNSLISAHFPQGLQVQIQIWIKRLLIFQFPQTFVALIFERCLRIKLILQCYCSFRIWTQQPLHKFRNICFKGSFKNVLFLTYFQPFCITANLANSSLVSKSGRIWSNSFSPRCFRISTLTLL